MQSTYGTGTPTQFTTGDARQVLELGKEIHYFNPHETPILTISGRARKRITPVPVFEWMEDEYFIKRSMTTTMASSSNLADSSTAGVNDTGCIVILDKLSYLELFEKGGVYTASVGGSASLEGMSAYMCVAIGKEVNHATPTDKMVQLVGFDTVSGDSYTYDEHATGVAIMASGANGTLTLTYAGNAGAGSLSGIAGASASQTNLTNNDVFSVYGLTGHAEGAAVHKATRKKVRRPKNCTMIFREPYDITGTQEAAEMYGPMELSRLQARKLKKIKTDIEWAILTRGAIDLDASAENPKRKFQGFGVGSTAGVVQSLNADIDSDLQYSYGSGTIPQLNAILRLMFEDQLEGSMSKDLFVSAKWMECITNRVEDSSWNATINTTMGGEARAGLMVTSFMGPIGMVNLIYHPLLTGAYEDYAIAIDWKNFDIRPLRTRDMKLRIDIVKNGDDGQTDEWLFEGGPEIRQEQTHSILKLKT